MNIGAIDTNLLLVLHLVLQERSATRAARRLHLTQSAVSNALGRLRTRLGDRLVVRTGRGLAPTPRAEAMAPLLAAAFGELERAVGREGFDASTCTRTFTFADSEEFSQLPRLARLFEERLPRATLDLVVSEEPFAARVSTVASSTRSGRCGWSAAETRRGVEQHARMQICRRSRWRSPRPLEPGCHRRVAASPSGCRPSSP